MLDVVSCRDSDGLLQSDEFRHVTADLLRRVCEGADEFQVITREHCAYGLAGDVAGRPLNDSQRSLRAPDFGLGH